MTTEPVVRWAVVENDGGIKICDSKEDADAAYGRRVALGIKGSRRTRFELREIPTGEERE